MDDGLPGAGGRRQQKRSPKAQALAGGRSVRPRRRRSPAAEAFAQAAGGRRQQKRSPKAQAVTGRCENPLSAQIAPPVAPFPASGPEGSVGRGAEFAKMLFPHLAGSGTAHARVI